MLKFEEVIRDEVVACDESIAPKEEARIQFAETDEVPTAPTVPVPVLGLTFAERYARFRGCLPDDTPEDLASQHDHYRLGTPKR